MRNFEGDTVGAQLTVIAGHAKGHQLEHPKIDETAYVVFPTITFFFVLVFKKVGLDAC